MRTRSTNAARRLSMAVGFTVVLAGLTSLAACAPHPSKPVDPDPPKETVVVQLAPVTKRDFKSDLSVSGVISSETEARLSFKTGGIVERMNVRDGDQVRQGQLLATLNPTEINAQVEQAQAGLDKAQRDLARAKDLFADSVATQEQLDNATTAWNIARQSLEVARFNQSRSEIRAPSSGVVLRKLMNEGELATPGATVFLFAGDQARDWVLKCGVSDRNWARLAKGDKAAIRFDAFPGETFQGAVDQLAQGSDTASGLYQVDIKVFPGARSLAAGLFGTGTVETGENGSGLAVPVDALVEGKGDNAKVFVSRNDTAVAVEVRVLELTDTYAVVRGNLSPGDPVIIRGAAYLRDGSPDQDGGIAMRITDISVKNWRFTLVMFGGVLALGAMSLLSMPRAEDPPFHTPFYSVVAIYPGTSAGQMEELVVKPIEKRLQNLDRLKRTRSQTRDGVAVFGIEYEYGVNIDDKYQELTREISAVRGELPPDLASLTVRKASSSDVNIYQWAIVSETQSYRALKEQADRLKDSLQAVKDLKSIDEWAFPIEQVNVDLELSRMAAGNVPVNRVLNAIHANNVNIPGGDVVAGARKFDVKTAGEIRNVDELRQTVVYTNGTKILTLEDIAHVNRGYDAESYRARLNGNRCIFVTAAMHEGRNIETVKTQVEQIVGQYRATLPASFDLQPVFDQARGVENRLSRFAKDFLIAILLVLVTLLPLGSRASLVVMIAIPLSLSIGLTILNLLGYTINQLSIVGMIVALGILVDDSIVVVENTERWLRGGASRSGAAIGATRQISTAILGCTVLLVLAFMPLMFLPGGSGDFIRSLPMAVISCVLASLLVALTVVPFLSSVILPRRPHGECNRVRRLFDRIFISGTQKAADLSLRHPVLTLSAAFVLFALSLGLFPIIGQSLFPKSEKPMFLVNIETPAGTNLDETDRIAARVEAMLVGRPHIATVATSVGHDNPQIYYNVSPRDFSENIAQVFVQLDAGEDSVKQAAIQRLRRETAGIPGARIEVKEFEQGPPVDAPVAYRVYSEDLGVLDTAAAKVENLLRQTPGTLYVDNPLRVKPTDLQVTINRDKAGLLGLSSTDVARDVRLGVAGLVVGQVRTEGGGDDLPIHVSLDSHAERPGTQVFDHIWIDLPNGSVVPLGQVATVHLDTGITQIRHYDRKRFVAVGAFVEKGFNVQRVNQEALRRIRAADLGRGVTIEVAGEQESSSESFSGIGLVVIITIFGFIGVLILEFRSFRGILIVLSIVPMGLIGALLMLLAFHETFSFTATIGLVALTGIEIKNSLLLVDFANLLRSRGMGLTDAVREAGKMRFLPILLTSLTAIGGLIPLIIEYNPLYSPLSMVLVGGIVSSTIAARFVTPVLYKIFPPRIRLEEEEIVTVDLTEQAPQAEG